MLQDGNILLRPLQTEDAHALALLANNKKIWDNLRDFIPHPYTAEDAVSFIKFTQTENPAMTFAINYGNELCGVIGLIGQHDIYKRTAEVGYWIGEPFWNKGIATTALRLITDYGFTHLNLIRIYTGVFEYNLASMKVLLNNGFEKEGVFRKAVIKNGNVYDEYRFAKTIL